MRRTLLLAVVLAGLLVGTAQAQTTIIEPAESPRPYQEWVDHSLIPTPDAVVTLVQEAGICEGHALACAGSEPLEIELLPPISGWPIRKTFFHELGHLTAYLHPELAEFGSERFADIYALCAISRQLYPHWEYSVDEGLLRGSAVQRECHRIRAVLLGA